MREELRIERKNRLLQAAAEVFCEKGYSGSTIQDVAARAGIGKGTVYGYFSSKEDLFFDLFFWYADGIMSGAALNPPKDSESVKKILLKFTRNIVGQMVLSVDMYPLTLEFWAAAASGNMRNRMKDAFEKVYDEFRRMIGGLIEYGIRQKEFHPETDAAAISSGIIGTIDAMGIQFWMNSEFDIETAAMHTVSAILTGISAAPASS